MNTESDYREEPSDEGIVCPKCILVNDPSAAFCAECGAPIGMVANTDPIQRIYAEGFAYRSAVEGPPSRLILAGMWAIFCPLGLTALFTIRHPLPAGIIIAISAAILYRVTKNYLQKARTRQVREDSETEQNHE